MVKLQQWSLRNRKPVPGKKIQQKVLLGKQPNSQDGNKPRKFVPHFLLKYSLPFTGAWYSKTGFAKNKLSSNDIERGKMEHENGGKKPCISTQKERERNEVYI